MGLETNTFDIQESKLQLNNPQLREIYLRIIDLIDWKKGTTLKPAKVDKQFDKALSDIQKDLGKLVLKDTGIDLLPEFQAISKMIEDLKDDRMLLKDFYKEVKDEQERLKESLSPQEFCNKINDEIQSIQDHHILRDLRVDYPNYHINPILEKFRLEGDTLIFGSKSTILQGNEQGKIHPQDIYKTLLEKDMLHPFLIGFSNDFNFAMLSGRFYSEQLRDTHVLKIKEGIQSYIKIKAEMPRPQKEGAMDHYKELLESSKILSQYLDKNGAGAMKLKFEGEFIQLYDTANNQIGRIWQGFNLGEIYLDETFRKNNPLEKKD